MRSMERSHSRGIDQAHIADDRNSIETRKHGDRTTWDDIAMLKDKMGQLRSLIDDLPGINDTTEDIQANDKKLEQYRSLSTIGDFFRANQTSHERAVTNTNERETIKEAREKVLASFHRIENPTGVRDIDQPKDLEGQELKLADKDPKVWQQIGKTTVFNEVVGGENSQKEPANEPETTESKNEVASDVQTEDLESTDATVEEPEGTEAPVVEEPEGTETPVEEPFHGEMTDVIKFEVRKSVDTLKKIYARLNTADPEQIDRFRYLYNNLSAVSKKEPLNKDEEQKKLDQIFAYRDLINNLYSELGGE